ncbi:MAG: carboxypeptidase-like regulatory domain-containing protein, partial [Cyclobacteriaceae bacterium]
MKYCITSWLLVCVCFCYAQRITVSGRIVDQENNEALPFASIGIQGKPLGTISNLQGEFDFHIDNTLRNDILVVNMLGYKTFEQPVWSLLTDTLVIRLARANYLLQEVTIKDSLNGGDIMRIALSRMDDNYPSQPFLMEGFYRDLKKVADTYISLLEAAVEIYDENYQAPRNKYKLRERVALKQVRRSLGYGSKFTTFFDQGNLLEDLLLHNSVRYRHLPDDEEFLHLLSREKDSYFNHQPVYVITLKQDGMILYVDKKTFGIIHLEDENISDDFVGKKGGMISKLVKVKRVVDFKQYEGKLFLNYLTVNSQINWYDAKTNALKFETEL